MKGVFYFDFCFDDDTIGMYGFTFECKDMESRFESDIFQEKVNELEDEYGIHDWSSSPAEDVYAIGYTTYEVERKRVLELMIKWRNYIISSVGKDSVSQIVDLSSIYNTYEDDNDVYNFIAQTERNLETV